MDKKNLKYDHLGNIDRDRPIGISLKVIDFRNGDLDITKLPQNGSSVKVTKASVITKRNTTPNKNYYRNYILTHIQLRMLPMEQNYIYISHI